MVFLCKQGRSNHERNCKNTATSDLDEDMFLNDDASGEESSSVEGDITLPTAIGYENVLAAQGTLDSAFITRHLEPQRHLTRTERGVLRFLRATETGGGCSRRQVEALLHHARSLGGDGALLPATYAKLWSTVDDAHARMMLPLRIVRVEIPVPAEVKCVLYVTFMHKNVACDNLNATFMLPEC